ncbi:M48 family metallopeptidase [Pseudorhodobacter sp.]|uniref:M48 family metallopeptidase n=1 Tax=Pseudorhodobacter sp. TaxID=1934400 RepID=UPI00264982E2|nr:M48 family metallopeptidase [Pseudorhodobacter sp.]MDN5785937.1 M48 family metallopeptidase [Pseudorhodobacter sp.]
MIGAAPVSAVFFDGFTAQRHPVFVSVSRDGAGLSIDKHTPGGTALIWPLDRLRVLHDQAGDNAMTLTLHSDGAGDETPRDTARLAIADPDLIAWLKLTAPMLRKRDVKRGTAGKVLWRIGFAVAAIVMIIFVILPRTANFLAEVLPLETEIRFGKTVVAQMERFLGAKKSGALICTNKAGLTALAHMTARLTDGQDLKYKLDVKVLDHPMVNAFAAPGGQIVILRGLLDKADSAEEVAAVLAHEIGHVEARDPTRLMLRAAGSAGIISIVLGDFSGGTLIGVLGDQLLQSAYTRPAEAAADEFGLAMLSQSHISSAAFADFFDKLSKLEGGFAAPEYLSSHPSSAGRAQRARDHTAGQADGPPVLTNVEWQALTAICKS